MLSKRVTEVAMASEIGEDYGSRWLRLRDQKRRACGIVEVKASFTYAVRERRDDW